MKNKQTGTSETSWWAEILNQFKEEWKPPSVLIFTPLRFIQFWCNWCSIYANPSGSRHHCCITAKPRPLTASLTLIGLNFLIWTQTHKLKPEKIETDETCSSQQQATNTDLFILTGIQQFGLYETEICRWAEVPAVCKLTTRCHWTLHTGPATFCCRRSNDCRKTERSLCNLYDVFLLKKWLFDN